MTNGITHRRHVKVYCQKEVCRSVCRSVSETWRIGTELHNSFLSIWDHFSFGFVFFTWKTVTKAQSKLSKFFRSHWVLLSRALISQNLQPNRFMPRILFSSRWRSMGERGGKEKKVGRFKMRSLQMRWLKVSFKLDELWGEPWMRWALNEVSLKRDGALNEMNSERNEL